MTFAEDKTYKYICQNHSSFCRVQVLEILPFLPCLTPSDQDRLRACYAQLGNQDTLWELFNRLQRRTGWVVEFIKALSTCELFELAEQVARVYQSYLPPGTSSSPPNPLKMPAVPAMVPGTSPSPGHSIPQNGYQEKPGYPRPVQDTQPPKSPRENSEPAPQTSNSGAVLRASGAPLKPFSNRQDPSPLTFREHNEPETELGGTHTTGVVSSLYGPVSPTVSFQPLDHSTRRASLSPGPMVSPTSTSYPFSSDLASAEEAGAQAATSTSDAGGPSSSVTTSSVPSSTSVPVNTGSSKVPVHPTRARTMPSKLPTSPKSPNVPIDGSKLPVSSTHVDTVASKMSTSMVPTKIPALPGHSSRTSRAKAIPETPATTVITGSGPPRADSTSKSLHPEPELSKPGVLASLLDSQPFSGCSEDLAISPSNSLGSEPRQGPEENEYESFRVTVKENPGADLLAGSPGPLATQQPQEEELEEEACVKSVSWVQWLGASSAVLAVLLGVLLFRRRLGQ